jgi:hypothetical protein
MSQIYVGYSPNDFFYTGLHNIDTEDIYFNINPTDDECKLIYGNTSIWNSNACTNYFDDNSLNCIKNAICNNKQNVNNINTIDNIHNSDYIQNENNEEDFKKTFLNTINLGIGILFIIFVITKMQSFDKLSKLSKK